MIDCQRIDFSQKLCQERYARIKSVLGPAVVRRILCFALYLLGATRKTISDALKVPPGSVRTTIRAIQQGGLPAFEDRRRRSSSFQPQPESELPQIILQGTEKDIRITDRALEIRILRQNPLQSKVVLLTFLDNGLVSTRDVAEVLHLSPAQVLNLARSMKEEDVHALIDKRRGPQRDYRFEPEVKAELIQQFVLDTVLEGHTSSQKLADHLEERSQLALSPRSIRLHLKKLGLDKIKKSLPALLAEVKKTPTPGRDSEK
jgi:transposase